MNKKRVIENVAAPLVGVVLFIAIWYIVAAAIGIKIILPSPTDTIKGFFSLLGEKLFYVSVGRTLLRTLIGFLIAFALACLFAYLAHIVPFFKKVFAPFAVMMRVMPTISVILLVLIWFSHAAAPYVITFFVIFPMLYTTVSNAVDNVDPSLLEMTKAFRFSTKKRFFSFYLPSMLPALLTGASITLSFSVKLTVAAEVIAYTEESIGRSMQEASMYMQTDIVLAWTLAAILLGFLLEGSLLLIRKAIMRHYYGE